MRLVPVARGQTISTEIGIAAPAWGDGAVVIGAQAASTAGIIAAVNKRLVFLEGPLAWAAVANSAPAAVPAVRYRFIVGLQMEGR